MDLIYFVLTVYGLTQILIYGSIFNKIRPKQQWLKGFGKLFHCPMCMGFWVSIFLAYINKYTELFTFDYSLATMFCLGCLGSGTSYILSALFKDNGFQLSN
jgi:uncharacterized membrane protein